MKGNKKHSDEKNNSNYFIFRVRKPLLYLYGEKLVYSNDILCINRKNN